MADAIDTSTPDPDQAAALAQIASHPALRAILTQIEEAPPEERLATAEKLANIDALREAGVDIPKGLRITTRFFENTDSLTRGEVIINPQSDQFGTDRARGGTVCVSAGWIVCLSYGWAV